MPVCSDTSNRMTLLTVRLWYNYDLLNSVSSDNCADTASEILHTVLAINDEIKLQSVPRDEWPRNHELQRHCDYVEGLSVAPWANVEAIRTGCREAIEQLCYLLELESIAWASAIETLCFLEE